MLHASQSRVPARLPTVLLGAVTGLTSALILELTGHSAIAILSLLAASIVLSYLATINPPPDPLFRLYRFCHARAAWSRSGIVLLLVGGFLVLDMALAHNPRDFGYASLLPAVLISGVFFGFGCGLLAVAIAVLGTDLLFGLSVSDFSIAEWKSLAVLATFTVLGALIGWAFWMLLSAYDDSIAD